MIKEFEAEIKPSKVNDKSFHRTLACKKFSISEEDLNAVVVARRSVDARRKEPVYMLRFAVYINEAPAEAAKPEYPDVSKSKEIAVIGFGPAGIFASLELIQAGYKPVIFERGKPVEERKKDIDRLENESVLNTESNYCFGEGGAGAFSDGKLYTRSKKGDIRNFLNALVFHGAPEDILIDSQPHIGSDKLPDVVKSIRKTIEKAGGEIHFNSRLTDVIIENGILKGIVVNGSNEYFFKSLILAAGHSARDVFALMKSRGVSIRSKLFAAGVRVEHPQNLIDRIQYHSPQRNEYLPPANYFLKTQADGRGVYSFCMCPGGRVIPASTGTDEVVLNGMSCFARNLPWANAGAVVSLSGEDILPYADEGEFAALSFQKDMERKTYELTQSLKAPAQRMEDFIAHKTSSSLPETSYLPGVESVNLWDVLPGRIASSLRKGLIDFGRKKKGYMTNEAVLLACETRTSSPVRIPRDPESLMHVEIKGLFPCGEGAGYAGGITSSAIDGQRCARAAVEYLFSC